MTIIDVLTYHVNKAFKRPVHPEGIWYAVQPNGSIVEIHEGALFPIKTASFSYHSMLATDWYVSAPIDQRPLHNNVVSINIKKNTPKNDTPKEGA